MASNSSSDQQLNEAGFGSIEVVTVWITALICFVGIALNASLVYVTVKTKALHSQCNVLIALYAFSAIFMFIGNSVKFFIFIFGIYYVTLKTCFYIQFINQSAVAFAIMMQLCIGLDRLAGVSFPFWYQSNGKYSMFKFLVAFSLIKMVVDKCIVFYGSSLHWETLVRCELADPTIQPEIVAYTQKNNLIISGSEFLCYSLIWMIRLLWKDQYLSAEGGKRLIRSLSVIMAINLLFYSGNSLFGLYVTNSLDKFTATHIVRPISFSVYATGHFSTVPVLLICSTEYRRAWQAVFWPNRLTLVQNMQPQLFIQSSTTNSQNYGKTR